MTPPEAASPLPPQGGRRRRPGKASSAAAAWQGGRDSCVAEAAARLAAGELVAFPTETVYGLGARADDESAVAAIFAAKGRPADHPLIVHLADAADVKRFAALDAATAVLVKKLAAAFWPGPLTLIVPRRRGIGEAAAGGQPSIGLRVPAHPLARALLAECRALGVPGLAAPSANRFGRISPTCAEHVRAEFGAALPVLDGGACEHGIESTIVDLSRGVPALLRPGRLTRPQLEAVLGVPLAERDEASPRASGTLEAHYAPSAKLRLFGSAAALAEALRRRHAEAGARLAVYSRSAPWTGPVPAAVVWRRMPDDAAAAAHELFAVLREFDAGGVQQIWVQSPPDGPDWEGVHDRLSRAAAAADEECDG